jgi:hypothetical protein
VLPSAIAGVALDVKVEVVGLAREAICTSLANRRD